MKACLRFFSLVALLGLSGPSASAATLTSVPMQGGMVMPMVSYKAADGRVHVALDPTIPQLIPLLASNPADNFAPEDPWYDALDPRRQGLAFSRRYGFVMGTMTDPIPAGTAIWIRKLSGSAEIGAYRYVSSAPKAFLPIFGTAGSAPALAWNGMMFHPAFTAPPGTNTYTATFDAYLSDTPEGKELPNTGSGPFTLTWTSVPDGRPTLAVGQKIVISWAVPEKSFVLEVSDGACTQWSPATETPVTAGGQAIVMLDPTPAVRIYRLRQVQ